MKDIWKKFKESCKVAWKDFKTSLSKTLKTTFVILKDGCIYFVTAIFKLLKELFIAIGLLLKAIFKWLKELFIGIVLLLKALLEVIWAALILALSATFGLLYEKIVAWIKKW